MRPPIYLPPPPPVIYYPRRRRVSILALIGEAVLIAGIFYAIGFGLIVVSAVLA